MKWEKSTQLGLVLFFLAQITACSPQPTLSSSAAKLTSQTALTPTSKGEQLTPTSKGEQKLALLQGEIELPIEISTEELTGAGFWIDGVKLNSEFVALAPLEKNQRHLSYTLKNLPLGQNIVVDLRLKSLQLSLMPPEVTADSIQTQNLNLLSTTLVEVARRAEREGIRQLKAWRPSELEILSDLPELEALSQSIALHLAETDQPARIFAEEAIQSELKTVLEAFLAQLAD